MARGFSFWEFDMSRFACYSVALISYLLGILSATDKDYPMMGCIIVSTLFIITLLNVFDDSSSAPATEGSAKPTKAK